MNAQPTAIEFGTLVATGTVKVGRWEYPAKVDQDGTTVRNTKRDRSGEWVGINADKFVPATEADRVAIAADVATEPVAVETNDDAEAWTDETAETIEKLNDAERTVGAMIGATCTGGRYFDFFDDGLREGSGIWFEHAAEQTPNKVAARKAFRGLAKAGVLEIGDVDSSTGATPDRWMSLTEAGVAVVSRLLAGSAPIDPSVLGEAKSGHRAGGGNQTKKPGKSTWELGTPCPQGIHTLTAETLYVMPSGRKQCRGCRAGMPSRLSK